MCVCVCVWNLDSSNKQLDIAHALQRLGETTMITMLMDLPPDEDGEASDTPHSLSGTNSSSAPSPSPVRASALLRAAARDVDDNDTKLNDMAGEALGVSRSQLHDRLGHLRTSQKVLHRQTTELGLKLQLAVDGNPFTVQVCPTESSIQPLPRY